MPFSFLCVSSFSAFLQEFPLTFAPIFYISFVCFTRLCVVTYGSPFLLPFASFALASGLCCFTCDSLLRSSSRWVFCPLSAPSSVLSPPSSDGVPLLVYTLLSVASPSNFGFTSFTFFVCFSLASALSSLVWFLLPSSAHLLSTSLPFPGLCCSLSRSLPVRPAYLSFFHSGSWWVFWTLIPIFLYGLFVLVSSVSSVLFFFSVLSGLYSSFVLCLSSLLCSPFQSSSSTPLLRPPLGFIVLSLLLYSPEHLYSSSWFFLWLLWGLVSVRWLTAAPTAPPLFRPLRLLCPLLLRSSAPAPIILSPFPHSAFPVAPSSLPLRFSVG